MHGQERELRLRKPLLDVGDDGGVVVIDVETRGEEFEGGEAVGGDFEHVLAMLAAGDRAETICQGYPWLEPDDVRACLVYARRLVGHERVVPLVVDAGT